MILFCLLYNGIEMMSHYSILLKLDFEVNLQNVHICRAQKSITSCIVANVTFLVIHLRLFSQEYDFKISFIPCVKEQHKVSLPDNLSNIQGFFVWHPDYITDDINNLRVCTQ